MELEPRRSRTIAAIAAAGILIAACGGGGTTGSTGPGGSTGTGGGPGASVGKIGGTVSIVATWSGGTTDVKTEQGAFFKVLQPFIDKTGIKVNYQATRDINAVLANKNALPDIAGIPGPGKAAE